MRHTAVLFLSLSSCFCLLSACRTVPQPVEANALANDDARLADVAFLAGSWVTTDENGARVEEHWTPASGGTLIGMSRTVARTGGATKTVFFEHLRLEWRPSGIVYIAAPKGGSPGTEFKLTERSKGYALFENPQHDFPTKISYRLGSDGVLTARIEGAQGGSPASSEWRFQRTRIIPGG